MGAAESSQRQPGELYRDPWWNPPSTALKQQPKEPSTAVQSRVAEERARLEAELEKSKAEVARLEKELERFRSEAARMGSEARARLETERENYRLEAARLGAELEAERRRTAEEQQLVRAELLDLQRKLKMESEARRLAEQLVAGSARRRESPRSEVQQGRQQGQQSEAQQQPQQQETHQQRAGANDEEDLPGGRRVLSSRKAAELERFKQEICVKREARHRALAAVSGEMGRLRIRMERFQQELERSVGPEAVAAIELELERERKAAAETGSGERPATPNEDERQGCKVSLEEDLHLRLEHAQTELERERELKRLLEESLEGARNELRAKDRLELELEGLRAELETERKAKEKLESELEENRSELEKTRLEKKDLEQPDRHSESIVCCLQSQLDCERAARRQLEQQVARMVENHAKLTRKRDDEAVDELKRQLKREKESRRELERRLEEVQESSKQQQLEMDRIMERAQADRPTDEGESQEQREQQEEMARLRDQVSALKEVATVGKQLLQLREQQVQRLEARLQAAGAAPGTAEAALGELRAEYERQLRNMDDLRRLYGERATAAAEEAAQLRGRLDEERQARGAAEGRLEQAQEALERAQSETEVVRGDLSQINDAFAQLLAAAAAGGGGGDQGTTVDLDELARRLHQNSGLLADIAAAEEEDAGSARLSRTLLELAAQVEAEEGTIPVTPEDPDGGMPASMGRAQIASNLPKVWKVLSELLQAAEQPAPGGGPPPTDVKSACYKSVDTPGGPQLVISVSQTFLRLKELILEKKSLQRELARLQSLNGHLETKLGRQQRRLALVSTELRKTWGVVGRMRAQHAQLHTHERLLRYELQHKRQLLAELRQELDRGRDSCRKATQVNFQSELEWRALRREFAARRAHAGSAESGCFSDPGEETTSAVITEGEEADSKDRSPASPAASTSPPPSPPSTDDPMPPLLDVETFSCDTVSMVKRLKEQLSWFSRSLDSVARDDEEALRSIFSLPAIMIPDSVYQQLLVTDGGTSKDEAEERDEEAVDSQRSLTSMDSPDEEDPCSLGSPPVKEGTPERPSNEDGRQENRDSPGDLASDGEDIKNELMENLPSSDSSVKEDSATRLSQEESHQNGESLDISCSSQSSAAPDPTKLEVDATAPPAPPPLPPPPPPPILPRAKNLTGMNWRVRSAVERVQSRQDWTQRISQSTTSNGGARSRRVPKESPTTGAPAKVTFRRLSDWEGPAPLGGDHVSTPPQSPVISAAGEPSSISQQISQNSKVEGTLAERLTTVESVRHPDTSSAPSVVTGSKDARKQRNSELVYQRLARCLDPGSAFMEQPQQPQQQQQVAATTVRSPEEVLEARSARLQRLEDQCRQLVSQVTRTTHRGASLASRLEELHEQYGSSSSPDSASPGPPSSPVTRRRQQPPQPPPGEAEG